MPEQLREHPVYVRRAAHGADVVTATFDVVKMEALDFSSGTRNLDLAVRAMRSPYTEMHWAKGKCRYLMPVFNGGCQWPRELSATIAEGLPVVLWAFDHVCLLAWEAAGALAA